MKRRDYKVSFRSDPSLAVSAESLRKRCGVDHLARFDITKVLAELQQNGLRGKGTLNIVPLTDGEIKPYVTYKPLTLHISEETLEHARWGDPDSNYEIAHEIGHIVLHDHYAQAFSNDPTVRTEIAQQDEESAEWQANRFAYHFLLPDKFVRSLGREIRQIMESCCVSEQVAKDRVQEMIGKNAYTGEACPNCGNFSLRSSGTEFGCDFCGASICR